MLRVQPERMAEALVSLVGAGLLDRVGATLSPHKWNVRQYKSDVSTERVKRFRQHPRNAAETPPEQNIQNRTEQSAGRPARSKSWMSKPWPLGTRMA